MKLVRNTFTPAYYECILRQRKEGTICARCKWTEIEHIFEPDKTCHKREINQSDRLQFVKTDIKKDYGGR